MTELNVNIAIEVLRPTEALQAIGPETDPTRLPWFDGTRDRHVDTPNLASAITAEPFGDHDQWLEPGVHLHVVLPAGLRRGRSSPAPGHERVGDLFFPHAPNRWFVRRDATPGLPAAAWRLDSDHVHDGVHVPPPGTAVALLPTLPEAGQPFVALGRSVRLDPSTMEPLEDVSERRPLRDEGTALTALTGGDLLFAARYGSCRNVFGFHDPEPDPEQEVTYTVWGNYVDGAIDPLRTLVDEIRSNPGRVHAILHTARLRDDVDPARPVPPGRADVDPTVLEIAEAVAAEVERRLGVVASRAPSEVDPFLPTDLNCLGRVVVAPVDATALATPTVDAPIAAGLSLPDALAALVTDGHANERVHEVLATVLSGPTHLDLGSDLGPKLREHAHARRFQPETGPSHWTVTTTDDAGTAEAATRLPAALARALEDLNSLQANYDRAVDEIHGLGDAAFADWHQLMTAAYPTRDVHTTEPIDLTVAATALSTRRLRPIEALTARTGVLRITTSPTGEVDVRAIGSDGSVAVRLAAAHEHATALLAGEADARALALTPGGRFFRPRDPVVALQHPALTPLDRGPDLAPADVHDVERDQRWQAWFLDVIRAQWNPDWVHHRSGRDWRPLLLEWEVELLPEHRSDASIRGELPEVYPTDFLLDRYELAVTDGELARRSNVALETHAPSSAYVAGRVLLNPLPARQALDRLAATDVGAAIEAVDDEDANPDVVSAIQRAAGRAPVLVAPLGGFHDHLLMRRAERQLPIDDPVGTPAQRAIAARVRAVTPPRHHTPLPDASFQPITSGEVVPERLRVVDAFGRSAMWRPSRLHVAPSRRGTGADRLRLPARLSQSARIDLRWLSADRGAVEMTSHPSSSPVCGWLLPNDLDGVVAVHDRAGHLHGSVDADGRWIPAPGDGRVTWDPGEIVQPTLASVVRRLMDQARDGTALGMGGTDVLTALDDALHQVDPADVAEHAARAVLVGRPIAVVRARLQVLLRHRHATDRSAAAARRRSRGGEPDDHAYGSVRIPVRLGEHQQFDDGLVAYWLEAADGRLEAEMRWPSRASADAFTRSIDDGPVAITMLLDPHGSVHATTGLLPTKSVAIPRDQYRPALLALRAVFRTAPLVTPGDVLQVPVPAEPGMSWAWLEQRPDGWLHVPHHPTLHRDDLADEVGPLVDEVWDFLVTSGRLVLDGHLDRGLVMPVAADAPAVEDAVPSFTSARLSRLLAALAPSIEPTERSAGYDDRAASREGWLELRPTPNGAPS